MEERQPGERMSMWGFAQLPIIYFVYYLPIGNMIQTFFMIRKAPQILFPYPLLHIKIME